MIKFLDLKSQYEAIKNEIDEAMISVINESAFIGGKYVDIFLHEFANYQQAKYCIGVANGTDALEIALESLDLPTDCEVIVPANSFIATSESVTRVNHRVVFCDCDVNNYTISIESLKAKITSKTKAVIVVHLYGHPANMDEVLKLADIHQLKIIEDCAQAHGAEFKGKRVGAIGDIGAFSFYPGKNLGGYGDGGAIVTNNIDLAEKCKMIANHGRLEKYNHEFEGRNSRLDGLQAAILSVKLKYLDEWNEIRIQLADYYKYRLDSFGEIIMQHKEEWAKHVYHLFVIRLKRRDDLKKILEVNGVQTGIHYPIALPKLKAYQYIKQSNEKFFANLIGAQLLSLPMGEHLTRNDIDYITNVIGKL